MEPEGFTTLLARDGHEAPARKRLEPDPANPVLIETVRGAGYRYRP